MMAQEKPEKTYVGRNRIDFAGKPYKSASVIDSMLVVYTRRIGGQENDDQTNFSDMLADMMHYADSRGFDFLDALQQAELNYSEEVTL